MTRKRMPAHTIDGGVISNLMRLHVDLADGTHTHVTPLRERERESQTLRKIGDEGGRCWMVAVATALFCAIDALLVTARPNPQEETTRSRVGMERMCVTGRAARRAGFDIRSASAVGCC